MKNIENLFGFLLVFLFAISLAYRDIGNALIKVDLTLLVLSTTISSLVYFLYKQELSQQTIKTAGIILVCLFYIFCSLTWTRAFTYGTEKLLMLTPYILMGLFLAKLIKQNISFFYLCVLFFTLFLLWDIIFNQKLNLSSNDINRLSTNEETNPIKFGKFLGFSILTFFYYLIPSKNNVKLLLFIVVSLFIVTIILLTGSKTPIVALVFTWFILNLFFSKNYFRGFLMGIIVLFSAYFLVQEILPELPLGLQAFINRRFDIIEDPDSSGSSRIEMIKFAYENYFFRNGLTSLFGNGIGDYSYASTVANYPHNLIVEILYEYGLPGFIFLLFIIRKLLNLIINVDKFDNSRQYFTSSCLYFFIIAQMTGDITGNFLFFTFLIFATNGLFKTNTAGKLHSL